ncbi:hypothetical protein LCGC14_1802540 [marine sediment metagenome]|uniref:ABC-type glycine betaine transport system substrate-binding domain-containing protein n=1 Tax=marine sediment metagenome TaxID=412755 RepID=A0A0F9GNZ1_9ZZZZ
MLKTTLSAIALTALAAPAFAACEEVTFADVGWTDITATTAATTVVLDALGYETDIKVLSVPVTYTSLAEGDIDVFLGNWMPTMEADIKPYREAGTVATVTGSMPGNCFPLDFGDANDPETWLQAQNYGSIEMDLLSSSDADSGDSTSIIVQQNRPY